MRRKKEAKENLYLSFLVGEHPFKEKREKERKKAPWRERRGTWKRTLVVAEDAVFFLLLFDAKATSISSSNF